MIEIPRLFAWRIAAHPPELSSDGNQINQRATSSQLNQSNFVLASLDRAIENVAVEAKHLLDIYDAQNEMINFADAQHGVLLSRLTFDLSGVP